ncbi:hypothetical protein BGZ74_004575 [Mortierella antarctica]|nr:hypothetical protein BGZ74_004575 [Mortierella antarctica]
MLSNKVFRPLFIAAAAVMLLSTVQAAPAFCPTCDEAPPCGLYCPGGYCEIDWCYCRPFCMKESPRQQVFE